MVSYRGCVSLFYFLPFSLPTFLIEGTATPLVLSRKSVSVSYHNYIHLWIKPFQVSKLTLRPFSTDLARRKYSKVSCALLTESIWPSAGFRAHCWEHIHLPPRRCLQLLRYPPLRKLIRISKRVLWQRQPPQTLAPLLNVFMTKILDCLLDHCDLEIFTPSSLTWF